MAPSTPKGNATRERLLTVTARLLKKQGYHKTGLQEIVDESQTPKGSLYFHFPQGKEQVVSEALTRAAEQSLAELQQLVASAQSTADAIERVFSYAYTIMARSHREDILPIGVVSLECGDNSESIRLACLAALTAVGELFREPLLKDGVPPEIIPDLTLLIAGTIEGGFVLSRTYADEKTMIRAGKLLADMVRSYTQHHKPTPRKKRSPKTVHK